MRDCSAAFLALWQCDEKKLIRGGSHPPTNSAVDHRKYPDRRTSNVPVLCRLANAVPAAEVGRPGANLLLLQHRYELFRGEP